MIYESEEENEIKKENIRNFSIVAHIDHGKSTLANLLIKNLMENSSTDEVFYRFSLEKERGITFKLHAVQLIYFSEKQKKKFFLNLIDTPGHADFKNEVFSALSVCEGVILLVDATKGIQSQTLFYYEIALSLNLKILPVINKIDVANAQIDLVKKQLILLLGCQEKDILLISAKTGKNSFELLEKIVSFFSSPMFKI